MKVYRFAGQDYHAIKSQCLKQGQLFRDPLFEPDSSFLRPTIILNNTCLCPSKCLPKFIKENKADRFDINQGDLGDCWFLSAAVSLTMNKKLFEWVVPPEQTFNSSQYCGLFRFRFYLKDDWYEVVIDDRLPTRRGKLYRNKSLDHDEFWSSLLEKAYAKFKGSYEKLNGGYYSVAIHDLTGASVRLYRTIPRNLFTIIKQAFDCGSLIGAGIYNHHKDPFRVNGLAEGHAYTITNAVYLESLKVALVRVRNPWGTGDEWTGDWSDGSEKWNLISKNKREMIGAIAKADGEFWMDFNDFRLNFDEVDICDPSTNHLETCSVPKQWCTEVFKGQWSIEDGTAGGSIVNLNTFYKNPNFIITLIEPDDKYDDELLKEDDNCTLIIDLMQDYHHKTKFMGAGKLHIGFYIYRLAHEQVILDQQFFIENKPICFSNLNDSDQIQQQLFDDRLVVTSDFRLPPGTYAIVPATHGAGEEGAFKLRVRTEKPISTGRSLNELYPTITYETHYSHKQIPACYSHRPTAIIKCSFKPSPKNQLKNSNTSRFCCGIRF